MYCYRHHESWLFESWEIFVSFILRFVYSVFLFCHLLCLCHLCLVYYLYLVHSVCVFCGSSVAPMPESYAPPVSSVAGSICIYYLCFARFALVFCCSFAVCVSSALSTSTLAELVPRLSTLFAATVSMLDHPPLHLYLRLLT